LPITLATHRHPMALPPGNPTPVILLVEPVVATQPTADARACSTPGARGPHQPTPAHTSPLAPMEIE